MASFLTELKQRNVVKVAVAYAIVAWVLIEITATDRFAPHGCYPCGGEDCWIAISVEDDEGWQRLCNEMGCPELATEPRFASAASRLEHVQALDEIVGAFTAERDPAGLEARLQELDIAAHRVLDSAGCFADPQLAAREHFVEIGGEGERTLVETSRSRLSRTPARIAPGRPTLGRDTNAVFEQVLGYDEERILELVIAEVLG